MIFLEKLLTKKTMPWDNSKKANGFVRHNTFQEGNWSQRFMVPARAVGALIGKGGYRAKELRANHPECRINIEGQTCPERIITISAASKHLVLGMLANIMDNLNSDFGQEPPYKRPPCVMGRGQKRLAPDNMQMCMLLHDRDCVPLIGKGGCRIKQYIQTTGCQVYVHNEYRGIVMN